MIILVDMDGVIADFEKGFLNNYRNLHPKKPFIPLEKRNTFYVQEQYPKALLPLVEEIILSKGFFLNLPPVDGSLESIMELSSLNEEVYICTSPLLKNPYCIQEKYEWINKYLGKGWNKKMILSPDKTLVQGDLLIDDKPHINGILQPSWEHILYSRPYNLQINSKRRLTWKNWKQVIYHI